MQVDKWCDHTTHCLYIYRGAKSVTMLFCSLYIYRRWRCYLRCFLPRIIQGTNSVIHLSLLGEVETCLSFRIDITIWVAIFVFTILSRLVELRWYITKASTFEVRKKVRKNPPKTALTLPHIFCSTVFYWKNLWVMLVIKILIEEGWVLQ